MPIYEYKCSQCNHITERFVPTVGAEREPIFCLTCGKRLDRIIYSASVIAFRGNGWARDGYTKEVLQKRCSFKLLNPNDKDN